MFRSRTGCLTVLVLGVVIYAVFWFAFEMKLEKRAANLYGRAEYARAADLFGRVIEKDPENADAYVARGLARLQLGDVDGALADIDAAMAVRPDLAFGHCARAKVWLATGRAADAMDECDAAIASDPTWAQAFGCRAEAWLELGQLDSALAAYENAFETKGSLTEEAWDPLLQLRPTHAYYTGRSIVRRLQGDLDGAIADCDDAFKLAARDGEARLNRGLALLLQGKEDEAAADFHRFIERRPDDGAYLEAQIEWARQGRPPSAALAFLLRHPERAAPPPQDVDSAAAPAPSPDSDERALTSSPAAQDTAEPAGEEMPPTPPEEVAEPAEDEEPAGAALEGEREPAAEEAESVGFFSRLLPRYVTLGAGIALILLFTGSHLVMSDLNQLRQGGLPGTRGRAAAAIARGIRVRRLVGLAAGILLLIAYFLGKQLPTIYGLLLGVFWLEALSRLGAARKAVDQLRGASEA